MSQFYAVQVDSARLATTAEQAKGRSGATPIPFDPRPRVRRAVERLAGEGQHEAWYDLLDEIPAGRRPRR